MPNEKVEGKKIAEVEGIEIYATPYPAKKKGKNSIWIQIRQNKPKRFRVRASLSYARSADI